jgi:ABC-type sugar transport system ATPase subunit
MSLLQVSHVTKRFGATLALADASMRVAAGEVHALIGENGSGKSTLSKVLAGVHRADSGEVLFDGRHIDFRSPLAAMEAGISIVHQELNLVPALSAGENLFLGQELRTAVGTVDRRRIERQARALFKQLDLDLDPWVLVERLPVAVRQMIEVARALTRKTRLLILDEPTSALGETEVQVLFRTVKRLRNEGVSIIYISHKMPEIFELCDTYTVLRDGTTVAEGSIAEVTEGQLVQSMVGRKLGDYYPARRGKANSDFRFPNSELENVAAGNSELNGGKAPLLRVRNLTRHRGNRVCCRDLSFDVYRGEIVGISGLVGAGRTELLEAIFGAAGHEWSGTVELDGKPIHPRSPAHAIDLGIGLVTEDRGGLGIFRQQSVLSNATVARLKRLARFGLIRRRREREAMEKHGSVMRIRRASDAIPIESLSGGNQQKVILTRWLMTNPKLLLLDEPTRGIDVGAKSEIYKVLRRLADEGIGILFVSSELPEVLGLADRILVISNGRLTADIPAEGATEPQLLEAAMR